MNPYPTGSTSLKGAHILLKKTVYRSVYFFTQKIHIMEQKLNNDNPNRLIPFFVFTFKNDEPDPTLEKKYDLDTEFGKVTICGGVKKIVYMRSATQSYSMFVFIYANNTQHLGISSLHAIRHMKNTVVDGVITLNDIICKPCHYSCPG